MAKRMGRFTVRCIKKAVICLVLLSGLYVLSWSLPGVSLEEVDMNTLHKIIRFFEKNYKPSGQTDTGDSVQYSVAINVPAGQCGNAFSEENFLREDGAEKVKSELSSSKLYKGEQLVAARPMKSGRIHSERALLMREGSNNIIPVQNLLNKDTNGCVVFYSYNSPCLHDCLNQDKEKDEQKKVDKQRERNKNKKNSKVAPAVNKCILKSLNMLTNHRGPKAFVFSQVYRKDITNANLASALQQLDMQVPLYKCNTKICVKCVDSNQNFNHQCLS